MTLDSSSDASVRDLPSVDELIRKESLAEIRGSHSQTQLADWARQAIGDCRARLLSDHQMTVHQVNEFLDQRIHAMSTLDSGESIRRVINATGVVLHTNLGRAPLADEAAQRVVEATKYCNVELNLVSGRRSSRGASVARAIASLVGADDAVIVNNCAAATILVLHALATGKEVIISRGQLVEIGGGFRLPDVFAAAGVKLKEVGTTNRTYLHDYENACGEETAAIIRVHRGNFAQTGFVTQPSLRELVQCSRPDGVPIIDDAGSGNLTPFHSLAPDEPHVQQSISEGADLVLFSGDKLFGGPQCGIVVGGSRWIDRLKKSPMMRAMRIDKMTLAALQATVEIRLAGQATDKLPVLRMIERKASEIRQTCQSVCDRLTKSGMHESVQVSMVECESQIGGGSMPDTKLDSFAVCIRTPAMEQTAMRLRSTRPAIQARLSDDQLLLDLRTVLPSELDDLISSLGEALHRSHFDEAVN